MNSENKTVRVVKASRMLQSKVGTGTIDEKKVEKSQKIIDSNAIDFKPMAKTYLDQLAVAVENAKAGKTDHAALIQELIEPVMQIKANAAMFDYNLVSRLANIMLNFLETITEVDENVLEIIVAHQNTLNLIVNNAMKGDGGEYGIELESELKSVCKRYFAKRASAGKPIEDRDAFFIDI